MTEPSTVPTQPGNGRPQADKAAAPRSPRRPLPSPLAVITATLGVFFIVLTLLAVQVRNGRDPALGPGPVTAKTSQPLSKSTQAKQATRIVTQTSPTAP